MSDEVRLSRELMNQFLEKIKEPFNEAQQQKRRSVEVELAQGLDLGLEADAKILFLGHAGGQQFDGGRLARLAMHALIDRADPARGLIWPTI